MRYLVAPDKFKRTMTALEVAEAIASGLRDGDLTAEVDLLPIADGGEGTATLLAAQLNADTHTVDSLDPLGRRITAEYFSKGTDAIFDVSEASGLWRVRPADRAPLRSSTYGSGVIIRHIIESGLQQTFIGLGGSATVDAGLGMAAALGYQFYDHDNRLVEPLPPAFSEIQRIQAPAIACIAKVIALADVETVLMGPEDATWTFGP